MFRSRGAFLDQTVNAVLPKIHLLLQNSEHDDRIAGRAYRAVLDGVGQLLNGGRIIPQACRGRLGHLMQRALVCGSGRTGHGCLPLDFQRHDTRLETSIVTLHGFPCRWEFSAATAMASAFSPSSPETCGGRSCSML